MPGNDHITAQWDIYDDMNGGLVEETRWEEFNSASELRKSMKNWMAKSPVRTLQSLHIVLNVDLPDGKPTLKEQVRELEGKVREFGGKALELEGKNHDLKGLVQELEGKVVELEGNAREQRQKNEVMRKKIEKHVLGTIKLMAGELDCDMSAAGL